MTHNDGSTFVYTINFTNAHPQPATPTLAATPNPATLGADLSLSSSTSYPSGTTYAWSLNNSSVGTGNPCVTQPSGLGTQNYKLVVKAVRDCYLGENAVLSECTLVENVFVHSSADEPTHLGAGVIVRNVVLGLQNVVDTNAIVRNVVTGSHVSLTDGLRISHTVVGAARR